MNFITAPIAAILQTLFTFTGDLGWSIILLTIIIRALLLPLVVPSMKQQVVNRKKLKTIQPQIAKLKKQYKGEPAKLSQAQMALYKEHGISLFSWSLLLPFVQIVFLIALYNVLDNFLKTDLASTDAMFYGINLVGQEFNPNWVKFLLAALSVITQFILSLMILPGVEQHDVVPDNSKSKKVQKANEKETDQQEMAEAVSQQMLFILPLITGAFALSFTPGVVLYWIATTVFSIGQQYFISGWGGLTKYIPWLRQE